MAAIAVQQTQDFDEQVYLIGRPPMGEVLTHLRSTLEGANADVSVLADHYRHASRRIEELTASEPAAADNPPMEDLPQSLKHLGAAVLEDPVVNQAFGVTPFSIKMVELDRLVVFQREINLNFARELGGILGESPSSEDVFRFALPIDRRYDPVPRVGPIAHAPQGPIGWAMLSPSTDYRILQSSLLDPSQVSGLKAPGVPTQIVALVVGYGTNLLTAMHVGHRLILTNGSHRAYAMREAGQTHVPALIQTIPEGEEAEHLPPPVTARRDVYLTHPRPPMVRDYFDEALRMIVHVPRRARQLRVVLQWEEGFSI